MYLLCLQYKKIKVDFLNILILGELYKIFKYINVIEHEIITHSI